MRFAFRANVEVIAGVMEFFGGLNARVRYYRSLANAMDDNDETAVTDAGEDLIANNHANHHTTSITACSGQSITITSNGEVTVTIRKMTAEELAEAASTTHKFHVTVELIENGKKLALSFTGFVFDMKEYWWLEIQLDDNEPMQACNLHGLIFMQRMNTLTQGLAPRRPLSSGR